MKALFDGVFGVIAIGLSHQVLISNFFRTEHGLEVSKSLDVHCLFVQRRGRIDSPEMAMHFEDF